MTDPRDIDDDEPVFPAAPPARIELPGGRVLQRCRPVHAVAAVAAINESLDHLAPWMAWAQEPATLDGVTANLAEAELTWDDRRDFRFHVVDAGPELRVIGGCGLHGRLGRTGLEIGYWIHADHAGRGIATDLARALTTAAFGIDGIERVRIQCEAANVRSSRVPEKLGYTFLGVTQPAEGPTEGRPTQRWEVARAAWDPDAPAR